MDLVEGEAEETARIERRRGDEDEEEDEVPSAGKRTGKDKFEGEEVVLTQQMAGVGRQRCWVACHLPPKLVEHQCGLPIS